MSEKTEETSETPKAPEWERKEEFGIVKEMKVVVEKTVEVTQTEITALQRKLERLQYGS